MSAPVTPEWDNTTERGNVGKDGCRAEPLVRPFSQVFTSLLRRGYLCLSI